MATPAHHVGSWRASTCAGVVPCFICSFVARAGGESQADGAALSGGGAEGAPTPAEAAFIQPGKPAQSAFGESFNGKMRNEWLNAHWWRTIEEARLGNEEFRTIHNTIRPHRSLGKMTPAEFAAADGSNLNRQAVGT